MKRKQIQNYFKNFVKDLRSTNPFMWYKQMMKLGGLDNKFSGRPEIESLKGVSDKECAEAIAQSFASICQEYSCLDRSRLPAFLPACRPEQVNEFQVLNKLKRIGKTKSTLPIYLPDSLG